MLLVFCLTLLLLTGCIVNTVIAKTVIENIENQENVEKPAKWPGLGMMIFPTSDNVWEISSSFEEWVDYLLANGFTQLRINITFWADTVAGVITKSAITTAISKGAQVIWGVGSGSSTLTAANWPTFRQAVLDAALWAQDNGVYEFQLGNEEELHIDDTTLTDAQLITNLKALATEVQAIFTNGNLSYSCEEDALDTWISAGKGDIDLIALNAYLGWGNDSGNYNETHFRSTLSKLVGAFGTDGCYLSEFGLSATSLDSYSTDEAVQAEGVTKMINYIKDSGVERAIFFCYYNDSRPFGPEGFGILKDDGTHRLLWNQALLNSGSVKSIAVPAKTAIVSLPITIPLLAK
jgi:hypothetical protein